MPNQASPAPSLRLPPAAVPVIVAAVVAGAAFSWVILRQRQEIAALKSEKASLTQAQRAATSRESAAALELGNLAQVKAGLAKAETDFAAASTQSAARITELEHLVTFLRGEVTAGQQTIERLKAEAAAAAAPVVPAGTRPAGGRR